MNLHPNLPRFASTHPYPLVFMTISGAHLYGFPSPDSDWDLRGVHVLPAEIVLSLDPKDETVDLSEKRDDLDADLVTHDLAKFIRLMLKRNGYVLEQLLSPIVIHTTPLHEELKSLVPGVITRFHAHHYLGFYETQWKLFAKEDLPRVKPLLYVYRVLLTGIHLMRTGVVEANLVKLNEEFRLPFIPELIERKIHGAEKGKLHGADLAFHETETQRLVALLEMERDRSSLPSESSARNALNELLVGARLGKR